jgi:hypothetical protein
MSKRYKTWFRPASTERSCFTKYFSNDFSFIREATLRAVFSEAEIMPNGIWSNDCALQLMEVYLLAVYLASNCAKLDVSCQNACLQTKLAVLDRCV